MGKHRSLRFADVKIEKTTVGGNNFMVVNLYGGRRVVGYHLEYAEAYQASVAVNDNNEIDRRINHRDAEETVSAKVTRGWGREGLTDGHKRRLRKLAREMGVLG